MAQARLFLRDFDISDPDYPKQVLAWALQAQCEMHELVLLTTETIAATRILIAEADRMLACKFADSVDDV
jgi:hypothetical protein